MSRRNTIELAAGQFSYLEAGEGDPMVFLHALGRSAADWLDVMDALEADWRCIALDQRGHGESVRPGQYRLELMVDDFRQFVDNLVLGPFVLVAHSLGGTLGWIFAEEESDRLRALILEDTVVPVDDHEYPVVAASPPEPVVYDWEARRQLFAQLDAPDPSWSGNLERITTPTLVIASSENEAELDGTVRRLPKAKLVTIDAGHWIHEAVPDRFVETLRSFLTEIV